MRVNKQTKLTLIYILFVLLTISTIFPVIFLLEGNIKIMQIYTSIYIFSIVIYTWYRFILLSYEDFRGGLWGVNLYTQFTVIVPCYNEEPRLLERCIESVEKASGNKKIIIIDDGSENNVWEVMQKLSKKYGNIIIHRFQQNLGKRHALYWAFKRVNTEFLITIDSDTIVNKNAFVYLIAPFVEKNIGATTGNIKLINERKNLLTRIIAGLYLSGLDNYKRAQSVRGEVICCSGCLSAYRRNVINEIAYNFLNQRFLGKKAAHSEDRHLTNLILEKSHKVVYVKEALCYTETPDSLKKFLKQQQRWKRGFVRESIYLLSFSWTKSKTLFIEATIGSSLPYFLSLGIQLLIILILFTSPLYILYVMIPGWIVFLTIRELPIFIEDPKRAAWFYFYIPLYEFLLFWQNMWAIFTVNNKSWLTRKISAPQTKNGELAKFH